MDTKNTNKLKGSRLKREQVRKWAGEKMRSGLKVHGRSEKCADS
jgi:hypothetical protein